MSPSTFVRAAIAVGLFTSSVLAKYDPVSKKNVAVYWGQGANQIPLSQVCADPSIDIVNIGFVNKFPTYVGDYPGTNHANACYADYFPDPKGGNSQLLRTCPGVEQAIKDCQSAGKKVLLSIGGGYPVNYTLPTPEIARWFAEFLIGAYGPVTTAWTTAKKPRPFGSAVLDGFDLDLEAAEWAVSSKELLYLNYDNFGKYVKANSTLLLSGAPQCIVPDARVSPALKAVPFDFLFIQFYNTPACSARQGYTDLKTGGKTTTTTAFTYDAWSKWLTTYSKNTNVKVYLGLPAGTAGAGADYPTHYLTQEETNFLIGKYQSYANFGGVMIWEATVSVNNVKFCKSFGYWVKSALAGTFLKTYSSSACSVTSSAIVSSSTRAASSSIAPIAKVSSSAAPVAKVSSSAAPLAKVSSSAAPLAKVSSSAAPLAKVSSSAATLAKVSSSAAPVAKVSSSVAPVAKVSSSVAPVAKASSMKVVRSLTPPAPSYIYTISSTVSSSIYAQESASAYPSSTPSVVYPDGYPTNSSSSEVYPAVSSVAVPYPAYNASSASSAYPTEYPVYPDTTPEAASSTPYSTFSKVYPTETPKGNSGYPLYPIESSKVDGEYAPSSTKKPEEYSSYPTGTTTTVLTTTYVDVCSTGLTTVTTVITKTVCNACAKPTKEADYPEDWTTSVYVDKTVTVTLTKPVNAPTYVPAYPSSGPSVYLANYPSAPKPSSPVYEQAYPEKASEPEYPTVAASSKAAEYPAYPAGSKAAEYPVYAESSKAPTYPAHSGVPAYLKKPVEDVTSTVVQYATLTKVPVAYTPAPYPTAPAPYVPVGAAKNSTSAYAPKPTGTGKPSKPSSYTPAEFEGAASRFGVGLTAVVGVVAAFLVL